MSDVEHWERRFVEEFILPARQDRYLEFLKGPKHRHKVLNRLNHNLDFDPARAKLISPSERKPEDILTLLSKYHVNPTCHVIADGAEEDGRELRLELAVELIESNCWGTVIICPPRPVAIYKEEDIGRMFLLT